MKSLPVGTAYAVWTGIGAVGAAITGILLLGESASPMRIASLALIVDGNYWSEVGAHINALRDIARQATGIVTCPGNVALV
ncbi:Quaternary ammonium compound-resistance protein sugE [Kluyvera cryocrescens]|uniref:Guanidinium exporter n=1 Tax=Kluyvera cryocrescens TaxID=580 RepID=A0A485D779_KLUCR|nr:Quaternary ammonium compound-resistance protein sugE [Kluyvera cryocrescens]